MAKCPPTLIFSPPRSSSLRSRLLPGTAEQAPVYLLPGTNITCCPGWTISARQPKDAEPRSDSLPAAGPEPSPAAAEIYKDGYDRSTPADHGSASPQSLPLADQQVFSAGR